MKADWGRFTALLLGVSLLIVVGPAICLCVVLYSFEPWDSDYREPPGDPRLRGHTDVLVVDPIDKVVRGNLVLDYEGRIARDPRWERRRSEIEAALPAAAEFVQRRLGVLGRPAPPFVVRFRDDEQMGEYLYMSTFQELRGSEFRPLVVVGTNSLLAGNYDAEKVLRHEIAHCWHLAALGEAFYKVPRWVKEGLAEWASGKGDDTLRTTYQRRMSMPGEVGPEAVIDGLDGRQGADDYGENYLAFAMVEELHGIEGVQRLVGELFSTASHSVAFQRVTGLGMAEFESRFRDWAKRRVAKDVAERPLYIAAKAALLAKEPEVAIRRYDAYLREPGHVSFRRIAQFESASARLEVGDLDGASASLESSLAAEPLGFLTGKMRHLSLRIAEKRREWARLEAACVEYLEDFGNENVDRKVEAESLLQAARKAGADSAATSPAAGSR